MKKSILFVIICVAFCSMGQAQFRLNYDPDAQDRKTIQYFKPAGNLFVGDCIPFYHDSTYYLYWLLDSGHHAALKGLGGHQWTLSTSRDLKNWKHHPVVLGIDEDWEKSICTGSVVYANNQFYAFYATRLVNAEGKVNERLSYAISKDGIHFEKQKPNPFYASAPGYSQRDFRDPKVVVDPSGLFHLFVSSSTAQASTRYDGAMVHIQSRDLKQWEVKPPLLVNQSDVPECPDYFKWGSWYYLIYGRGGNTFYLKSRQPYGPWEAPATQALDEDWSNVVKQAEFTNGRRITAGWIPTRNENKDDGHERFGGNIVLRELLQLPDGTLGVKFPPEAIPESGAALKLQPLTDSATVMTNGQWKMNASYGMQFIRFDQVPNNSRVRFTAEIKGNIEEYGLFVRASPDLKDAYKISLNPDDRMLRSHNTSITGLDKLTGKVTVDLVMKDDIIDVCINGQRCLVNRLPEQKGTTLALFAKHGIVTFSNLTINPLNP